MCVKGTAISGQIEATVAVAAKVSKLPVRVSPRIFIVTCAEPGSLEQSVVRLVYEISYSVVIEGLTVCEKMLGPFPFGISWPFAVQTVK